MFKPVPTDVSFPKLEEDILAFWREHNTFEKSLAWRKDTGQEYVFYDGPPLLPALRKSCAVLRIYFEYNGAAILY
jgi:isoleucyl-tRNA synthetase